MRVRGVDPRDTSWEVDLPSFRVHFFGTPGPTADGAVQDAAHVSDEYEVTEADVHETIAWANRTAGPHRTYVIYLVLTDAHGSNGMVKLAGQNPNDPREPRAPWMIEHPAPSDR
jgi:hypothetical protein